jgi:hypothetical protein
LYNSYFLALTEALCTTIFSPDKAVRAYSSMHNLTIPEVLKLQTSGQGELTNGCPTCMLICSPFCTAVSNANVDHSIRLLESFWTRSSILGK